MSVIGSNILAGASGQGGGYNLTKSLRFRSSASAYLNRTFASAGNQRTWTWSAWVKRGALSTSQNLFGVIDLSVTNRQNYLTFQTDNTLAFYNYTTSGYNYQLITTQVFRDPSAWYHIVCVSDTTQATSSNRLKLYINGTQITAFSTASYPSPNFDGWVNSNAGSGVQLGIGRVVPYNTSEYFDGYMAEVNFIDGQALTPSSFGQTSTTTGVWQPIKYTGTYGTNGFYLPFTDTTSTSTLGTDFSGNSNTWTVNNISLTAGSTYDSMNDVPTLTSATTANYWTLNPLNTGQLGTVQSGNLEWIGGDQNNFRTVAAQILPTTGKFYWEVTPIGGGSGGAFVSGIYIGIMNYASGGTGLFASGARIADTGKDDYVYYSDGRKVNLNSFVSYGNSYAANDVIGIAVDIDNGKIWYSKNGTWQASGDPAAGTNAAYTTVPFSTKTYAPAMSAAEITNAQKFNFGQRPFAYTPPTGFVALNTFNLPTPTIGATASSQANKYFDVKTWSGNSSTQSIPLEFAPDLIWNKSRSAASGHSWWDVIRGAGAQISSNETNAETTGYNAITSFSSNAISLGADNTGTYNGRTNETGRTYVGWAWKANGTGSSNTAGSITSTVSANTTAGFSIVTWTGSGSTATIGHGLGVTPSMIIWMHRTNAGAYNHGVYHSSLPSAAYALQLSTTLGQSSDNNWWNSTAPTSSVFTVGGYNISDTMVAYCFAPVAGYSAFGSYTGNGSTDGTFVFTGFRPKFVMVKRTDSSGNDWEIRDTSRDSYNSGTSARLWANSSASELNDFPADLLSNGFKPRSTGTNSNGSGATYIYMAFAESPFKYANAR